MELKESTLAVSNRYGLAFFDEMVCQTVYPSFGEFLSASLARVLIPVAGILQLGAALEELEDQLIGFSAHFRCSNLE